MHSRPAIRHCGCLIPPNTTHRLALRSPPTPPTPCVEIQDTHYGMPPLHSVLLPPFPSSLSFCFYFSLSVCVSFSPLSLSFSRSLSLSFSYDPTAFTAECFLPSTCAAHTFSPTFPMIVPAVTYLKRAVVAPTSLTSFTRCCSTHLADSIHAPAHTAHTNSHICNLFQKFMNEKTNNIQAEEAAEAKTFLAECQRNPANTSSNRTPHKRSSPKRKSSPSQKKPSPYVDPVGVDPVGVAQS